MKKLLKELAKSGAKGIVESFAAALGTHLADRLAGPKDEDNPKEDLKEKTEETKK